MGRFEFSNAEHAAIRRSASVQAELKSIASRFASAASSRAGDPGGYETDMVVGSDRARAHVWPKGRKANRAEAKHAYLMGIIGDGGVT